MVVIFTLMIACDDVPADQVSENDDQDEDSSDTAPAGNPKPPPDPKPSPEEASNFISCSSFIDLESPETNVLDGDLNVPDKNPNEISLNQLSRSSPPSATFEVECDMVDAPIGGIYTIIQQLTEGAILKIEIEENFTEENCEITRAVATVTFSDESSLIYVAERGYTADNYVSTLHFSIEFEAGTIEGIVVTEALGPCG